MAWMDLIPMVSVHTVFELYSQTCTPCYDFCLMYVCAGQWGVYLPNELLAQTLSWMSANHGDFLGIYSH